MFLRIIFLYSTLFLCAFSATIPYPIGATRQNNPYASSTSAQNFPSHSLSYNELNTQINELTSHFQRLDAANKTQQQQQRELRHFLDLISENQKFLMNQLAKEEKQRGDWYIDTSRKQENIQNFLQSLTTRNQEIFIDFQQQFNALTEERQKNSATSKNEISELKNEVRRLLEQSKNNKSRISTLENEIKELNQIAQQMGNHQLFSDRLAQQNNAISTIDKKINDLKQVHNEKQQNISQNSKEQQRLKGMVDKFSQESLESIKHLTHELEKIKKNIPKEKQSIQVQTTHALPNPACVPPPAVPAPSCVLPSSDAIIKICTSTAQSSKINNMSLMMTQGEAIRKVFQEKISAYPEYLSVQNEIILPFIKEYYPQSLMIEGYETKDDQFWKNIQDIIITINRDKKYKEVFAKKSLQLHNIVFDFPQTNNESFNSSPKNRGESNNFIYFIIFGIDYMIENKMDVDLINKISENSKEWDSQKIELMIFITLAKIKNIIENCEKKNCALSVMINLKIKLLPLLNQANNPCLCFCDMVYEEALKVIDMIINSEKDMEKSAFFFLVTQRVVLLKSQLDALLKKNPHYLPNKNNISFNRNTIKADESLYPLFKALLTISQKSETLSDVDLKLIDIIYKIIQANFSTSYRNLLTLPFVQKGVTAENARILFKKYAELDLWRTVKGEILKNATQNEKTNFDVILTYLKRKDDAC